MSDLNKGEERAAMKDEMEALWDEMNTEDDDLEVQHAVQDGPEGGGEEDKEEQKGEEEKIELDSFDDDKVVDAAKEDEDEDDDEPLAPLQHWRPELRESFKGLPREAQEFVVARDKEFQASVTRVQQEAAEARKRWEPVAEALEPVSEEMRYYGITPADTVRTLVGAHKMLLEKPAEGVRYIMGQYGVSPEEVMKADAAPKEPSEEQQRLAELEQREAQRQFEADRGRVHEVQSYIQRHFQEHPDHAPALQEMTVRANAYRAAGQVPPPLTQLFEEVKWNVPEIRERLVSTETKDDKARRAASVNVDRERSAGRDVSDVTEDSTRDTLLAEWEKAERQAL